jgi:hypothetical protein
MIEPMVERLLAIMEKFETKMMVKMKAHHHMMVIMRPGKKRRGLPGEEGANPSGYGESSGTP